MTSRSNTSMAPAAMGSRSSAFFPPPTTRKPSRSSTKNQARLESTFLDKNYFHFLKELIQLEEREEFENIRQEFTSLGPAERQLRGKALMNLRLFEKHFSPAGHSLATFRLENKNDLPIFSLEPGDMV